MRASRALAVTAAACAAVVLSAPLAGATNDPRGDNDPRNGNVPRNVTVNPTAVFQGGTLFISAEGCSRGATVESNAFPSVRLSPSGSGRVSGTARIYDRATPGQYNLAVRCSNDPRSNDPRGNESRDSDSNFGDSRDNDSQSGDPRDNDSRGSGSQSGDPRDNDSRGNGSSSGDPRDNGSQSGDQRDNDSRGNDPRGSDPRDTDPRSGDPRTVTRQFTVLAGRGAQGGLGGSVGPSSTEMVVGAGLVATAAVGGTLFIARRRRLSNGGI